MASSVPTVGSKVICDYKGVRRVGTVANMVAVPGGGFLLRVIFGQATDFTFVSAAQTEPADGIDEFLDAVTGSA